MKVPFLHKTTDEKSSKSANIGEKNAGTTVVGDGNITNVHMSSTNPTDLTNEEKKSLKEFFLNDFKRLHIFDSSISYSMEEYQPLSLKKNSSETFISEEELFEELNQAKKVNLLLIGDIGSGKTTLVKRLVYDAFSTQSLNQYDFIFYIDLANMDDNVKDIQSLVSTQYHHILPQRNTTIKIDLNAKNLFIFDGLDKIKPQSHTKLFYDIQKPIPYKVIVSRNNSIDINKINHDSGILYVDGFKGAEELQEIEKIDTLEECESNNDSFAFFIKKLFPVHEFSFRWRLILFFSNDLSMKEVFKNPLFLTYISTKIKLLQDLNKIFIFEKISQFLLIKYNENQFKSGEMTKNVLLNKSKEGMRLIAHKMYEDKNDYADDYISEDIGDDKINAILKFGFLKATQPTDSIDANYQFINPLVHHCLIAEEISQDDIKITSLIQEITFLLQTLQNSPSTDYNKLTDKNMSEHNNKLEIFSVFNRKLCAENSTKVHKVAKELQDVFDNLSPEVQIEFLFDSHLCIENLPERLKVYENDVNFNYKPLLKDKLDTLKKIHCCKETR